MPIGKLEKIELRELWKHEERGLSAWLTANLDSLSDALGIALTEPHWEVKVGAFEVDLVAEDENANRVIIENQLEPTDHDRLGTILTYMTNFEARVAVWITKVPRPEHVKAVAWLNETAPDDISFFLVRLDAYSDRQLRPGSPLHRHRRTQRGSEGIRSAEEGARRRARPSIEVLGRPPGEGEGARAPASCMVWIDDKAAAELYIDTGDRDDNKAICDALEAKRHVIDEAFGGKLEWERLDEKRACRIRHTIEEGGLTIGEEQWPKIQDAMIDAMRRLVNALKPHLPGIGV